MTASQQNFWDGDMTKLKIFLTICACVAIVSFTWTTIVTIGLLTLAYGLVRYVLIPKFKNKLGKIFN